MQKCSVSKATVHACIVPEGLFVYAIPGNGSDSAELFLPGKTIVSGKRCRILEVVRNLVALKFEANVEPGPDIVFLSALTKFALEIVARQRYLPTESGWEPVLNIDSDRERFEKLVSAFPFALLAAQPPEFWTRENAAAAIMKFIATLTGEVIAESAKTAAVSARRNLYLRDNAAFRWVEGLLNGSAVPAFAAEIQEWKAPLHEADNSGWRMLFRLEEPTAEDSRWCLAYYLQSTEDAAIIVSAAESEKQEFVRQNLMNAAGIVKEIAESLKLPFDPIYAYISDKRIVDFIEFDVPLLQEFGFSIALPDWARRRAAAFKVKVKGIPAAGKSCMSMDEELSCDAAISFMGSGVSISELEELASMKQEILQFHGKWIFVKPEELAEIVKTFKKFHRKKITVREAIRTNAVATGANIECDNFINVKGYEVELLSPPATLTAALRPYQTLGYSWISSLVTRGYGVCLADDMGLGKTVQTISALQRMKDYGLLKTPALIICPTSVVGNWQSEIRRFAPALNALVFHGAARPAGKEFQYEVDNCDVVITSFSLCRQTERDILSQTWSVVVVDEAQNIKNPHTQQAQFVRSLKSKGRVALTGTPIENRLTELWSIMHFLNPGYLGSLENFRTKFVLPIERYHSDEEAEQVRALIKPFVLRRTKTDRSIISDLPDKVESKSYVRLTKEQASLYLAVLKNVDRALAGFSGIKRKSFVFTTLLQLKQICNHPAQLLKDYNFDAVRSQKLGRLMEMLEEVLDSNSKALIFTQFVEMGRIIELAIRAYLKVNSSFLHGGVERKKRDGMVQGFQEKSDRRIMLLSLKAGGTGLNLTAANYVFHFDRWWNPAVENQATDRAFRIGQTQKVFVYKFIAAGTVEEGIDRMIEQKKDLANRIVGSGESWISEISDEEFRELIKLRMEDGECPPKA